MAYDQQRKSYEVYVGLIGLEPDSFVEIPRPKRRCRTVDIESDPLKRGIFGVNHWIRLEGKILSGKPMVLTIKSSELSCKTSPFNRSIETIIQVGTQSTSQNSNVGIPRCHHPLHLEWFTHQLSMVMTGDAL